MNHLTMHIVNVPCSVEPNIGQVACKACDEIDEYLYFTPMNAGPFCSECLESLCDPDQALLSEARLASYES